MRDQKNNVEKKTLMFIFSCKYVDRTSESDLNERGVNKQVPKRLV